MLKLTKIRSSTLIMSPHISISVTLAAPAALYALTSLPFFTSFAQYPNTSSTFFCLFLLLDFLGCCPPLNQKIVVS